MARQLSNLELVAVALIMSTCVMFAGVGTGLAINGCTNKEEKRSSQSQATSPPPCPPASAQVPPPELPCIRQLCSSRPVELRCELLPALGSYGACNFKLIYEDHCDCVEREAKK